MSMFCHQCQEAAKGTGCAASVGVCGKGEDASALQDLLNWLVEGLGFYGHIKLALGKDAGKEAQFVYRALFSTITNANFDADRIRALIHEALDLRAEARRACYGKLPLALPEQAVWFPEDEGDIDEKAARVGWLSIADEDERAFKSLILYGLKGIAAYADHAAVLGKIDPSLDAMTMEALSLLATGSDEAGYLSMVMRAGEAAVKAMALLDAANTGAYGKPEVTSVDIGVRGKPGILVSGHDLKDLEELLDQSAGTGVDVYTHSEMLPAHYYPAFKKYEHFAGNYGNAWWKQGEEFAKFNGAILMTTNCIVPVKEAYRDRIFTTGMAGYPGVPHIAYRREGGKKDFSAVIERAKRCAPPEAIESGSIVGGFAHDQVAALAGKIVDAVKTGAIKKFVVMAGCDGRMRSRDYYTGVAKALPKDAVILTAGCAKYRYNKLDLGDIGDIPRVLDAGQCNDSYSLALTALALKDAFGMKDVNELPIAFDIAWYEQKAVAVLLALLHLGFKGIRLGPTLPAFLSPKIAGILVEKFGLKPIATVEEDVAAIMGR